MAIFNLTNSEGSIAGDRIRRLRTYLGERIEMNRQFRRTYDELQHLSDRDLADLGLVRSDIGRVARETVYGAERF